MSKDTYIIIETNDKQQENENEEIIINTEDQENFHKLTEWLINIVEITPYLSKKYSQVLLEEGIGSIHRLKKRIKKDKDFLNSIGIKEDDAEEILLALQR